MELSPLGLTTLLVRPVRSANIEFFMYHAGVGKHSTLTRPESARGGVSGGGQMRRASVTNPAMLVVGSVLSKSHNGVRRSIETGGKRPVAGTGSLCWNNHDGGVLPRLYIVSSENRRVVGGGRAAKVVIVMVGWILEKQNGVIDHPCIDIS
jgi:hypothetical protein